MTTSVVLGRDEWIARYNELASRLTIDEVAAELDCTPRAIRQRLHRYGMKSSCVSAGERSRQVFAENYHTLVGAGLSDVQIADRLGYSSVNALNRRVRRCGCRVESAAVSRLRGLVGVWVARGVRFSRFDFPEWVSDSDADFVVAEFLRAGRIVRLGPKSLFGVTWSLYGPADG